jgi:hypothetical protein
MHPPRPNGATERPNTADRLADWLLSHCPLTTLTLLTMLVGSAVLDIPRPWQVLAVVATADVGINLFRWRRRVKRSPRVNQAPMRSRATA